MCNERACAFDESEKGGMLILAECSGALGFWGVGVV